MTQLSFSDLAELPRWQAKHFSSEPLPDTPEYQSMKEFEELDQRQRTIPKELAADLWWLEKVWDEGGWKWAMNHRHTKLKTAPFISKYDAIDQAWRLATFYELLPIPLLRQAEEDRPTWFTKLPTLLHWYQYNWQDALRWAIEYRERHPEPEDT